MLFRSKRFAGTAEAPFLAAFPPECRARTVLCPKSGHFPTSTEPDVVVQAMRAFLAETSKA